MTNFSDKPTRKDSAMTDIITVNSTCTACGDGFTYLAAEWVEAQHGPRPYCDPCGGAAADPCPNCGQLATDGFHVSHVSENLDACPQWVPGQGWVPLAEIGQEAA